MAKYEVWLTTCFPADRGFEVEADSEKAAIQIAKNIVDKEEDQEGKWGTDYSAMGVVTLGQVQRTD